MRDCAQLYDTHPLAMMRVRLSGWRGATVWNTSTQGGFMSRGGCRSCLRKVTEMGTILGRLNECRRIQVAAIKQRFDDGRSTAEQTRDELKTVRAGIQRDNTLIEGILGEVTKRKGVYVASIGQVEEQTEAEVLGDVAEYTPETSAPTTVATGSSTIDVSTRPTPENDVQRLELASREVGAVYEADSADLFREIDEMEELTLI